MTVIVSADKNGHIVYNGLLTSEEKADADEFVRVLKKEIPQIEEELQELYGSGVLYKYNLGIILGGLLEKYRITPTDRRRFWNEIRDLATKDKRKRAEGKNSDTRSYYEQCYRLSQIDMKSVEKLKWRQWQALLDRTTVREDPRIFSWVGQLENGVGEIEWREFVKALTLYLGKISTDVFDDETVFGIYDSIMRMCRIWLKESADLFREHPELDTAKSKTALSKKYYERCFVLKKEARSRIITDDICRQSCRDISETISS